MKIEDLSAGRGLFQDQIVTLQSAADGDDDAYNDDDDDDDDDDVD